MSKKKVQLFVGIKGSELYNKVMPRVQAFLWNTGWLAVAASLDVIVQELSNIDTPNMITVMIAAGLTQTSKYVNKHYYSTR